MEEILEQLGTSAISKDSQRLTLPNSSELYKNNSKKSSQDTRRKELLENQKKLRSEVVDTIRGIWDVVKRQNESKKLFKSENKVAYKPSLYVAGFNSVKYSNVLMMSEWLTEKPSDFEYNWLVVPCPKATRVLVVVCDGRTRCFSKFGHFMFECKTGLPGGNRHNHKGRDVSCAFDCFYHEGTNTFYILDILVWNGQPCTDGEAEFRHFWLTTRLAEQKGLDVISKKNEVKFSILPKVSCDPDSFENFMNNYSHFQSGHILMDGLLFYHKKANYTSGKTPLVGWLYPFMVPEILMPGLQLLLIYSLQKPENYTNQAAFIEQFEEKYSKKNARRTKRYKENDKVSNEGENQDDQVVQPAEAVTPLDVDTSTESTDTQDTGNEMDTGRSADINFSETYSLFPGHEENKGPFVFGPNSAPE